MQALQQWYQFLADLYRAGVRAALAGSGAVQLKSVDVRLHLDRLAAKLGATPLDDAFADAARDEFDFSESDTKLKRVAKMFHRSDAMKEPATAAHCSVVRENTLVRNILQHNDGVIRAEDVGQNGGPFTCDTGKATHRLDKGEQVHRTVFDLSTCVRSMVAIANALVV